MSLIIVHVYRLFEGRKKVRFIQNVPNLTVFKTSCKHLSHNGNCKIRVNCKDADAV